MSIQPYKHKETLCSNLLSEIDERSIGFFLNCKLPEKVIEVPSVCSAYGESTSEPQIALRIAFLKIYFAAVEEAVKTFACISQQKGRAAKKTIGKVDLNSLFSENEQNVLCKIWLDWLLITGSAKSSPFPDPWQDFRNYIFCKIVAKAVAALVNDFKNELQTMSSEIIREYSVDQYSMIFYSQLTEKLSIDILLGKAHRQIVSAADQAECALIDFLTKKQYLQGEK